MKGWIMSNDPCKKEYEEFLEAMNEWTKASNARRAILPPVTEPLDPIKDVEPKNVDLDEWRKASEREKAANEDFITKNEAYLKCRKQHGF
jgi:hypothetical protein